MANQLIDLHRGGERSNSKTTSCTKSYEHFADEFRLIFVIFIKYLCQFSIDVPHGAVGSAYATTAQHKQSESQTSNGEYLQEVTRKN